VRRRALRAAALLLAGALVAACGSGGSDAAEEPSGGGGPARNLVVARDMDLNSADPQRAYCDTCQIYLTSIYQTLIGIDVDDPNTQVPRLAKTWEGNADNTRFTFRLDPAAKFSDGSPVEAKDVKWSWERLANLKGSASYLMTGYTGIEVPDAQTVVVSFGSPNSAFLPIVSATYMGIVNSDVASAEGKAQAGVGADASDQAEQWFSSNSAGSGPYTLKSYTQNEQLEFVRNENFWQAKPVFPAVTMKAVKDSITQVQQLQQGDVDIAMQVSFDALSQLEGNPKVTATPVDTYNYVYIALSPGAKGAGAAELGDLRVRQAIRLAIDDQGVIDTTVAGKGKRQASPIPNGFLGSEGLALPRQDVQKAKDLLAAAGRSGGFTLDATYPKANVYGVDFDVMMQKVKQDLAAVNIDVKLTPVDFTAWADLIGRQGIPLTAVYFAPDHTDSSQYVQYFGLIPESSWAARAGGGKAGQPLSNPAEAALYSQALAAAGDAKKAAYEQLGKAMQDDAIILPLVNPQLVLASASDISNMHLSACCNLEFGQLGLK
jgi:peptide/nickel transport system substrate-binding protein